MPGISRDTENRLHPSGRRAPLQADQLAEFIETHAPLFVLTGAGCSTGSGIPDYRDDNGEWKHGKPVQYADFLSSGHARRRYWARSLSGWPRVEGSRPNGAHTALAELERTGLIEVVCTQNVDTLHEKAGSAAVIDLHGRLDSVECLECDARYSRALIQDRLLELNPGYQSAGAASAPDGDVLLDRSFDDFVLVSCDHCGGVLKPQVVFFGENVPAARVERAMNALERSRGMLVVGSSLMVYSGYRFCRRARELGKPVAAVNRGKTRADAAMALKVSMDCEETLQRVAGVLCGR
ncbi:MAG: NAD-dependent protein deacetylase [Arenicellales bacterium]